jgi:MFS family permease
MPTCSGSRLRSNFTEINSSTSITSRSPPPALTSAQLALGDVSDLQIHCRVSVNSSRVYFGYAVAQYPVQLLIGRYPAQRVLSITIFMWGLCVLTRLSSPHIFCFHSLIPDFHFYLVSQCTNFKTAMINRFCLGIFEASVSPGLTLMTCAFLLPARVDAEFSSAVGGTRDAKSH